MKGRVLWAVMGLAAVTTIAVLAMHRPSVATGSSPVVAPTLQTKVFKVDQMTCATCPITVRTAMSAVRGVTKVTVDFDTKTATVTFDPAVATVAQIAAASTNAGYPATPAS